MAANKAAEILPSDALIVKSLLLSMGVKDYDPRVVHQLLDFMYRNISDVLHVSQAFSDRTGAHKHDIGLDDVMLAIQAQAATSLVMPPSHETLQAMAERRNSTALPSTATAKYGFRLPPAEDCLIAPNVQFQPQDPPENMEWEEEPITSGGGAEPFAPPPVAKARPGADVQQQHPAFHDPEQSEAEGPTPQQSQTGDSAATSTATNARLDSGGGRS